PPCPRSLLTVRFAVCLADTTPETNPQRPCSRCGLGGSVRPFSFAIVAPRPEPLTFPPFEAVVPAAPVIPKTARVSVLPACCKAPGIGAFLKIRAGGGRKESRSAARVQRDGSAGRAGRSVNRGHGGLWPSPAEPVGGGPANAMAENGL